MQQREPMTWSDADRRHMIDRPRFGLEEPAYRDYVARQCLGLVPGMEIADVGCGSAASSLTLLPYVLPGGSLTGYDRDAEVLHYAEQNAAGFGADDAARFVEAGATDLPAEDASFDVTLCQTVLMHVADPGAVLDEMVRVTRPGGLVAATEPDWTSMTLRNLSRPPRRAEDAALWAEALARIIAGGRQRGAGDWSIGATLVPLFRARGLATVRARSVPASWMVATSANGRRSEGALRWAVELFYPEPGLDLNAIERENFAAAGGSEELWDRFEDLRARERCEILDDFAAGQVLLHVHTAAYLTVGRVPEAEPASDGAGRDVH